MKYIVTVKVIVSFDPWLHRQHESKYVYFSGTLISK